MNSGGPPQRDLYEELCDLSSEIIARIYDASHELKDGGLRRACLNILWARHAVAGGEWPQHESEIGPITLRVGDEVKKISPACQSHLLRSYCRSARPVLGGSWPQPPDDHAHRVARSLQWSYVDLDGDTREFSHLECTCGARADLPTGEGGLVLGRVRIFPVRGDVWPSTVIPGINNGHPVFIVCKFSKGVQDPLHAPNSVGFRCICGASLGVHSDSQDQYISVQ